MSILSIFRKKESKSEKRVIKYYLNYLGDTTNGKWKTVQEFKADEYKESLDDISVNPPPGLYKFIAHYEDDTMKVLWNETVGTYIPAPAESKKTKKESPVDKILSKIAEQVDFSEMKLKELNLPSGDFNLRFVNPSVPQGGSEGGYMIVDGQQIPVGQLPPLEFEGKLPVWLHPAVTATISSLVDKLTKQISGAFGSAIRNSIGIGSIQEGEYEVVEEKKEEQKTPDDVYEEFVDEFDEFVSEDELEELDKEKHDDETENKKVELPEVEGELPDEVIDIDSYNNKNEKENNKDYISTEEI